MGWKVMGSMLGLDAKPNCVIAKDVKSCTYCCYVRCATLIVRVGENALAPDRRKSLPCTAQIGLTGKGRAIKGLVVGYSKL